MRKASVLTIAASLLAASLLGSQSSLARQDIVPGSRYTSGRGAGMGDTLLPLADDGPSALFYNPAGLGKIRGTHAEPMNIQVNVNQPFVGNAGYNSYKIYSLNAYKDELHGQGGAFPGYGLAIFPSFFTRGFGFGLLAVNQVAAQAVDSTSIRYRSLYQMIPTAGFGVRLASGILRLGYSLQWVHQANGDITVSPDTDNLGYNQGLYQGSALSHNLGFAMTLPIRYLPSLAAVARNVGGARFTSFSLFPLGRNTIGAPPNESMTIDIGASIQPKFIGASYMNLSAVYRDATNRSAVTLWGRIAFGTEIVFRNEMFLRGGWSSGYPSAGLGVRHSAGELSLAWYSEDVGSTYHAQRDMRYLFQYVVRAF